MAQTRDKVTRKAAKSAALRVRKAETTYSIQLRKVARHVGEIVNGFKIESLEDFQGVHRLTNTLRTYSELITEWAGSVASSMLMNVAKRDEHAWYELAAEMSRNIGKEIQGAPTGQVMKQLMAEQVTLIKSIPLDAAQRVHELTIKGLEDSTRAGEIAKAIREQSDVSIAQANCIARTEVSRSGTSLMQARCQHIGSNQYVWRTVGDADVRSDHAHLNGKVFSWDEPPIADRRTGARAHPGCIYNCRCYAEPIIADED